jgi:hypothetical protein
MRSRLKSHSQKQIEKRNALKRKCRKRGKLKKPREAIYKKRMTTFRDERVHEEMKKERKKFVIWQIFGNNHDVPFTTVFSDYIFAKLGTNLQISTSPWTMHGDTQSNVKCEMCFNIFSLFSCAHFSLGYKIPSIFLRPIKRWKKSAKQNEWHDARWSRMK